MARSAQARERDQKLRISWKNRRQRDSVASIPGNVHTSASLGLPSVSDRLNKLIEPYEKFARTDDRFENLVTLGVAGWNLANMPEDKRVAMMSDLLVVAFPSLQGVIGAMTTPATDRRRVVELVAQIDPELCEDSRHFLHMVTDLMFRKIKLFPGDCRMIVKAFFEDLPDQRILRVASYFKPDQKPY